MNLHDLMSDSPPIHRDSSGNLVSWQLDDAVLHYLDNNVSESSKTLETGAGISTILFAIKSNNHFCIVPDERQVNRIISYCKEHLLEVNNISFMIDYSEKVLPQLVIDKLDLVLIDGRHAFPTPFIDWFYTYPKLKVGGKLVIDDTHLWTGSVLKNFLLMEPEWKLDEDFSRSSVFIKLQEGSHNKLWIHQPYLTRRSIYGIRKEQLRYIVELIWNRDLNILIKKIFR